jgi:F-type H+-transporting ATPase subunit c
MSLLLAEISGNIGTAFGLLGQKAAEAVGRNPGASGKILVQAIIGMALAEGLGILALFLAK